MVFLLIRGVDFYVSDDNPVLMVLSTQKVEAQQSLESQEFCTSSIVKTPSPPQKKKVKKNKEDRHTPLIPSSLEAKAGESQ